MHVGVEVEVGEEVSAAEHLRKVHPRISPGVLPDHDRLQHLRSILADAVFRLIRRT